MDLSVIILNYNVRYLLEACLESVIQAVSDLPAEIIVVDNASSDESVYMVQTKYPEVKLIINDVNTGFSRGNNHAVAKAGGDFVLILNPDTVINSSAVNTSLHYLKEHKDTGAVGVKMINGQGKYLNESKRGFPDVASSFFKLSGLNRIFPGSAVLNHYYLGHLSPDEINEVESLTGAFMMMSRHLYQSLNGFDENFFMYGEDIDLSFRIRQEGKKLIYIGNEKIIHLKGRSSVEHSYKQVYNFYNAMSVFVRKYEFKPFLKILLLFGIKITAHISWLKRQIVNNFLPVADWFLISLVLIIVQQSWATVWFKNPSYFHHMIFVINALSYTLIWLVSLFLFNAYQPLNKHKGQNALEAILTGTFVILMIYGLLPEAFRTSRAVILISGLLISFIHPLLRNFLSTRGNDYKGIYLGNHKEEAEHNGLFRKLCYQDYFSYLIRRDKAQVNNLFLEELKAQIHSLNLTHLIVDTKSISKEEWLILSAQLQQKISILVIKSDEPMSFDSSIPGLVSGDINLNMKPSRIKKSLIDLIARILILPWGWMYKDIRLNYFALWLGRKQFAGYQYPAHASLPGLKPALWSPVASLQFYKDDSTDINFEYARQYNPYLDIKIILNQLFTLKKN
ncbi:MAG: glycosyltransferase [Saprospiraceae bacterium]